MDSKFAKIGKLIKPSGMIEKLSPLYEHQIDKSPDATLMKPNALKMNKKVVKL